MRLESFPLTPNHKIDRKALPRPSLFYDSSTEEYVAPTTKYEMILADVFSKALGLERIGINDDIFNYPVDSLVIIQIQTMLITYGWKFKTQDFYKLRTIKELAILVENQVKNNITSASNSNEQLSELEVEHLLELNNSLSKHNINDINVSASNEARSYLLTGCNGYLGIHVLENLIKNTNSHIYCLLRGNFSQSAEERLLKTWNYYFNKEIDLSRITVYDCDITKKDFALSKENYDFLAKNITTVINCAANVKYYGLYKDHEKINVTAVKNLIDFCIKNSIHLNHVSTLGVSGNYLVSQNRPNTIFTENDFYIWQNYKENVYIHSKFDAEKLIYENQDNLNFTIFRIGNLTARSYDGVFQHNIEDNAFYNILRFIINNKILPNAMASQSLEFTPVDLCADALVKLSMLDSINHKVFHLFNNNTISISELLEMLTVFDINVEILDTESFNSEIVRLSKDSKSKETLKAVVNDLDSKNGLSFMPSVIQNNDITNEYLYKLGIIWPKISFEYIKNSLIYMSKNNYITWEETNEKILSKPQVTL